ncbi:MAG TPA: hypothetical protein VJT08_19205, partial [Terriglobales bacterium]|nr:hypothetical protein [Terriglobales bacterium]
YPSAFSWALCATDFYLSNPKEVSIVGENGDPSFAGFKRSFWEKYLPNRVLALGGADSETGEKLIPLLANRRTASGSRAYVCEAYKCQKPAETPGELTDQLSIR